MEFRLLGAVEAWSGGQRLDLGPRQQRLVLAVLALSANELVPVDRLVDLTWPESPPQTARHAIHVRVSQLRAVLASASVGHDVEIATHGRTYVLRADPMCVDAHRFRSLIRQARAETDDLEKDLLLRRALDMWHGPPLADVATPQTSQICRGLEEARLAALEEWLGAQLRLGRHSAVIDELTELAERYPHRQRLLAQLMLALYRDGRVGDALDAYRRARTRLVDQLGLDPGLRLQQLERAILRADPALDMPAQGRRGATKVPPVPPILMGWHS